MGAVLRSARPLQLTLAMLKPDAVAHPLVLEAVHETILNNKFLIVRTKELMWRREDSQRFYQEHSGRFFYQRLVEFMASGPMRAYILAHEDAVARWRSLMGPTKVYRARNTAPDSIRGAYGLTDTRNTTHGSGSKEMPAGTNSGTQLKNKAARMLTSRMTIPCRSRRPGRDLMLIDHWEKSGCFIGSGA
ncbi:nucleoside diphosphate kinase 6 isoform X1 [Malaclemys terrapin pileata]|uniref:nucleoside diphosphate kinase 6 isoform X1 n=1 Tax=Malaclemys terrapin pileata TaxID=2991368 RepID=UPI0023A82158|nr:nucleoside diphosphate kinase 6 isoform X1 [Malaclemys terrapin pileata]